MKKGFTLAEVLITLGIVGIVASLTIPNLVRDYKIRQLESAFKNTDSMIQQALKLSINELGYTDINDLNYKERTTDENVENLKQNVNNLNDIFLKQLNIIKRVPFGYNLCQEGIRQYDFLGRNMSDSCWTSQSAHATADGYILKNGVSITGVKFSERNGWTFYYAGIAISFDTNGPYKGPNRLGYDIFTYASQDNLETGACSPMQGASNHNLGCYHYAKANKSPLNPSESYWNLLYKPLSYWENYNKN